MPHIVTFKPCPRCGTRVQSHVAFCRNCGYGFHAPPEPTQSLPPQPAPALEPTQAFPPQHAPPPGYYAPPSSYPPSVPQPRPKYVLIVTMWLLTASTIVVMAALGRDGEGVAVLLDIPALVIALVLVFMKTTADRVNGWVKIALEILGFVSAFLGAMLRSAGPAGA